MEERGETGRAGSRIPPSAARAPLGCLPSTEGAGLTSEGLIQLCFFPLPLFSPSWATRSSLAASWDCAINAPERARSPGVPLAPLRLEGGMLEGWGVSGMGDAWWERC